MPTILARAGRALLSTGAVLCLLAGPAGGQGVVPPVVGDWSGALRVGAIELRLVLHVVPDASGSLQGSLDSPDQGAAGLPVESVTFDGKELVANLPALMAKYTARLVEEGAALDGTWEQAGQSLPLVLKRGAVTLVRPQEPKPPYPYDEEEVTVRNEAAGLTLAGTLTLPREGRPAPAVLLVSGSGPQDRDEALMGHKPFHVLADHLSRRGIAVLRMDDRGVGKSTGDFVTADTRDFASDARAALAWLRGRPEVRADRVGLLGHSEGALVGPMVATEGPGASELAFLVLLAGPAVTGEEILYEQGERIARAMGESEEAVRAQRASQRRCFAAVREGGTDEELTATLRGIIRAELAALSPAEREKAAVTDAEIDRQAKILLSPWMRFFLTYDPQPALRALKCPTLALFGDKDLQVPPSQNAEAMAAVSRSGGNPGAAVRVLPGLNHLFQEAETGLPGEYGKIEQTMSPAALDTIANWILAQAK